MTPSELGFWILFFQSFLATLLAGVSFVTVRNARATARDVIAEALKVAILKLEGEAEEARQLKAVAAALAAAELKAAARPKPSKP